MLNQEIKVSVIIPVYNVEKFIGECVRSLMEQTLDNVEYIFVNDCTPDKSIDILKNIISQYPSRLPFVKIIENEKNIGVNGSRKAGVRNATGMYIAFCDSDDTLQPDMLELMYSTCKSGDLDFCFCDCNIINHNTGSTTIEKYNQSEKSADIDLEDADDHLSHVLKIGTGGGSLCNKMFRRQLFDNDIFWPDNHMNEDWTVVVQLVLRSKRLKYIERPLYNYMIHNCSRIHNDDKILEKAIQASSNMKCVERILKSKQLYDQHREDIVRGKIVISNVFGHKLKHVNIFPELKFEFFRYSRESLRYRLSYLAKCLLKKNLR